MKEFKGILCIIVASLFCSTAGTFQALAPEGATPWTITEMRMSFGAGTLFLWCLATGRLPKTLAGVPWKLLAICIVSNIAYQFLFFSSLKVIGVAVGSVISIGTTPIWAAFLEWVVRKKRPKRIWYVATLLAIAGIVMLNAEKMDAIDPLYALMPVAVGLANAAYMVVSPDIMRVMRAESAILLIIGTETVLLLPTLFLFDATWIATPRGLACSAGLGVFTAAIAITLFIAGLKTVSPPVAATLCLIEPMGAACLGIFFLGEAATLLTWTGIGIVLAAVALLSRP